MGAEYRGRHRRPRRWWFLWLAAVPLVLALVASPAHASTSTPGGQALSWAEAHALGHPYVYGGTGPYGYDCSGTIYAAVLHADGIVLPRTTYGMLAGSPHLYRVSVPRRGDLAFWGSGHVEFVTAWWHVSFGAHHSGTLVSYRAWNGYYAPTAYYRIR